MLKFSEIGDRFQSVDPLLVTKIEKIINVVVIFQKLPNATCANSRKNIVPQTRHIQGK